MKNKKVSILLAFALVFTTLLTACGSEPKTASKPAGEVLSEAVKKQFDLESAHFVMEGMLNVDISDEQASADPSLAMVAPFLKEAKLTIDQNSMVKDSKAYMMVEAEAGGQKFTGEVAMESPTKMLVKSDLYPQVIVIDTKQMMETASQMSGQAAPALPTSMADLKPVVDVSVDIMSEIFKGVEPTSREAKEIEFASGKESLDMITYSYKSNDEVLALVEKVMNNYFDSEKMYDLITDEKMMKLLGEDAKANMPTKEQYLETMKQAKEMAKGQMDMMKEEFAKAVDVKELTLAMGIDGEGNMRYTNMVFDGVVKQDGQELPIKISLVQKADNINAVKAEDVKTIEVTEENSINLEELIMQQMMGGMQMDMDASEDMEEDDMMEDEDMADLEAELEELDNELELTDEEQEALDALMSEDEE